MGMAERNGFDLTQTFARVTPERYVHGSRAYRILAAEVQTHAGNCVSWTKRSKLKGRESSARVGKPCNPSAIAARPSWLR